MMLPEAIERYLCNKRASGLVYETEAGILLAFRHYVNDPMIADVTPKQVIEFLNLRQCSNGRWMTKRNCLRMFFEFWTDRDEMAAISMPQPKRTNVDRIVPPRVYTQREIQRLIQATQANQANLFCAISGRTFRTILLTLYATGARTGEVFWLKRDDLDLKRRSLFLCGDKKLLPRRVPLNRDLRDELSDYLHSEERRCAPPSPNLFVSRQGEPIRARAIVGAFGRLAIRAGLIRADGVMRKARMCDLRQTFAVHRITAWMSEGADLNCMLPALSAYMGFSDLCSVQRLLRMVPQRFKRELDALSPRSNKKHWRDTIYRPSLTL
jgi:integrase